MSTIERIVFWPTPTKIFGIIFSVLAPEQKLPMVKMMEKQIYVGQDINILRAISGDLMGLLPSLDPVDRLARAQTFARMFQDERGGSPKVGEAILERVG